MPYRASTACHRMRNVTDIRQNASIHVYVNKWIPPDSSASSNYLMLAGSHPGAREGRVSENEG